MVSSVRLVSPLLGLSLLIGLISGIPNVAHAQSHAQGWSSYGGDPGGMRYSALDEIDRNNVEDLELAWSYRTGARDRHPDQAALVGFHATPILAPAEAGGALVLCTPFNKIVALDPATGRERWSFDPAIALAAEGQRYKCRGVAYWHGNKAAAGAPCSHRILMGTSDRRLIAVDTQTGAPCAGFGDDGEVNVETHMTDPLSQANLETVKFSVPSAIINDVVILGSTNIYKFFSPGAPAGTVRAFDARSGDLLWTFDPIPRSETDDHAQEWTEEARTGTGGANAWILMSVDEERDLVFVPTSSAAPDFFGGKRPGDNRYANSLVALKGSTGEVVWHYQIVHHDVWDRDLPAQPLLVDLERDGQVVPAVVQLTKQGFVFVFNRETGEPLFPIEERSVPTDGVPGEILSPTQPFPTAPPPLVPQEISPDDAWGLPGLGKRKCKRLIKGARYGGLYTPPSTQGTIMYPGPAGGSNWGGGAIDPVRNILVTPVTRLPFLLKLTPIEEFDAANAEPMITGMGKGPPPIIEGTGYVMQQEPLLGRFSMPCTAPPWATLVAVDLDEGTIAWDVPLGTAEKFAPMGLAIKWGTPPSGGSIVTAGGLVFVGATLDEKLRAFDIETGDELWQVDTPTASNAVPMTYEANGRQFIVVASGGHPWYYPQGLGDYLVAYALPELKQD